MSERHYCCREETLPPFSFFICQVSLLMQLTKRGTFNSILLEEELVVWAQWHTVLRYLDSVISQLRSLICTLLSETSLTSLHIIYMTLSINIDPSPHVSDSSYSDDEGSSSVHIPTASELRSHPYQNYDEWAHLPYPDGSKPSDSASRPTLRTPYRSRPPHGSRSASGRPTSRQMVPEHQSLAPRSRRQQSSDSPDSADFPDEYPPNFGRNGRRNWQQPMPFMDGYAPNQCSGPSKTPYPSAPPFQRQSGEMPRTKTVPPDFILRAGDQAKDVTVHLDLDAAVDINPDLECLSRLNRLGNFKEASRLFEERLVIHVDFFPVVAEYADLLLEQGSFGQLHDFLSTRLKDPRVEYSDEEVQLMRLLRCLAEMYTRGALIPALEMAVEVLGLWEKESKDDPPGPNRL
ncbi:hypothetical protein PENPOL_c002G04714 [Penicillium polonicum]|uniref:Uncharacterized protein n=1 Tax=Penicillium polonicum TaxID=60169 RepID=A0A1V6NYL7_PENPO|nr:hypothetical protein PENPOL_c002G04714 [Penicillium polonicum]